MPNIIDQYLDVDFRRDPNYVKGYDEVGISQRFAAYEDVVPMIPESDWRNLADEQEKAGGGSDLLVNWILNQRQEGSCVGNASTQAHMVTQARMRGKSRVIPMSAISLYKRIGSSAQSGANVNDAIDELCDGGLLPLDTPQNRAIFGQHVMPPTGFKTPWPSGWKDTAIQFVAKEWHPIKTLAGMMTAMLNQHPVVVGRQGHSINYLRAMWRKNAWVNKYANSWHQSWGDNGFGYDSLSQMKMSSSWAFALRSISVPALPADYKVDPTDYTGF